MSKPVAFRHHLAVLRAALLAASLLAGACRQDVEVARAGATGASGGNRSAPGDEAASSRALAPVAAASAPASSRATAAPTEKVIEPIVPDKSGLVGKTIDFQYDGADVKDTGRAYEGRIFVHEKALKSTRPVPLIVFLHGLNREFIAHRWMGGGTEGDVRKILSDLLESGAVPPAIIAGPGSVAPPAVAGGASFPIFDHDKFVAQVVEQVGSLAEIDQKRVIVMGHSGAGCSDKGGVISATTAQKPPYAVLSIDTCMAGPLAQALGSAPSRTNVIVTWQAVSWERDFVFFKLVFEKARDGHPAEEGILRELDCLPALPRSHDATVKQTFDKWLPRLLPPG